MKSLSRRSFVRSAAAAGLTAIALKDSFLNVRADHHLKRKMTINLTPGAIGVQADQNETIRLAAKYGFESVEAKGGELARLSDGEMSELKGRMKELGVAFGAAGLPVDFRRDEETFRKGIEDFPRICQGLQQAGVDRISTWLSPSHDELTYMDNFRQHTKRLREVAAICKDHGQRFGMEYVGTQSLLVGKHYPFVHTLAETADLIDSIGTGNCGYVLDSWHWWTAGDSLEEIKNLDNKDVVAVDLNDAPTDTPKPEVRDNRRHLPASTGVIDVKAFLNALNQIRYDGPVRAEPFNQELNAMDNEAACEATADALKKAFALIEE